MSRDSEGLPWLRFMASITATIEGGDDPGSKTYVLEFTTRTASAKSADGTRTVQIAGMPLVEGARSVQLVGATTNTSDAFPAPGRAVTTVLSGTFDQLPRIP